MDCVMNFSKKMLDHMISAHVVVDRIPNPYNSIPLTTTKCMECDLTFSSLEKYHIHLLSHVDSMKSITPDNRFIKRYKCSECGQKFVQKSTLEIHETVHKPFPFVCDCGVGYYLKADLLKHKDLVHETKFKEEFQKLTSRKQRTLINEFWTPHINYTGPKAKQGNEHVPEPVRQRVPGPRLKAELVIRSNVKKDKTAKNRKCSICSKILKGKSNLRHHERIHTGEKPYQCKLCDKRFTQKGSLHLHLERHKGIKNFSCDFCGKAFAQRSNMVLHKRTHTGEKPYSCQFCGKCFSDPSAHGRHERTHTGVKPYACNVCGMRFSDASGRITHERRHTAKKSWECELCSKVYYTKHALNLHYKSIHIADKRFECDYCHKCFSLKHYLVFHIKHMHSKRTFIYCDYCDFRTSLKSNLEIHIKRVHFKEKNHECNECGWKFFSKSAMQMHLNAIHLHLLKFECDTCQNIFHTKSDLLKHISNRHLNIKCKICAKPFSTRQNLEKHQIKGCVRCEICDIVPNRGRLKNHYDDVHKIRNHECKECFKMFQTRSGMKNHYREVHSQDKNFECHYCGDSFSTRLHILNHIYTNHLDYLYCNICKRHFYSNLELNQHKYKGCKIKKYLCEICDKTCNSYSSLNSHLLLHCDRKMECHHCSKQFRFKSSFIRHIRLVHKEVLKVTKNSK